MDFADEINRVSNWLVTEGQGIPRTSDGFHTNVVSGDNGFLRYGEHLNTRGELGDISFLLFMALWHPAGVLIFQGPGWCQCSNMRLFPLTYLEYGICSMFHIFWTLPCWKPSQTSKLHHPSRKKRGGCSVCRFTAGLDTSFFLMFISSLYDFPTFHQGLEPGFPFPQIGTVTLEVDLGLTACSALSFWKAPSCDWDAAEGWDGWGMLGLWWLRPTWNSGGQHPRCPRNSGWLINTTSPHHCMQRRTVRMTQSWGWHLAGAAKDSILPLKLPLNTWENDDPKIAIFSNLLLGEIYTYL